MAQDPEHIISFWLDEVGPKGWYTPWDGLDDDIRDRFLPTWEEARSGQLDTWRCCARSALALLLVTDQFPRNMFRGSPQAFETDALAREVAGQSIVRGYDMQVASPARQFFYLPLEHSETLPDQARAVRLIASRMDAPETLVHARAHREVIRRFGRFPYRNEPLGRRTTQAEARFIEDGGYGAILREVQGVA
ncbi:hypothetical protein JANAI62_29000 [Jannaschia pagri]|uniref:DUF924 domain-containing protein n=1 Tax=Jannaschia pagri TaxID=2829797 RepID=A0ABQ4NPD4_9RHOB|nr:MULTISPECIES: DUF924 family protein [unclassified Jannaschia]GIT92442.1 hypothetical protein JANAI61_29000 [Jannaschia sp. AI_61]GIT96277.1 hypothetical protein JANAI62_29000 [Jannaschia sp. AI_62]